MRSVRNAKASAAGPGVDAACGVGYAVLHRAHRYYLLVVVAIDAYGPSKQHPAEVIVKGECSNTQTSAAASWWVQVGLG